MAAGAVHVTESGVVRENVSTLRGYSVESGSAVLHNGDSATDPIICFADNADGTVWMGPDGVAAPNGIFAELTGEGAALVVYVR